MQKVLLVVTKGNWGGAQRYVFDLATALRSQFNVAVVAGMPGKLIERLEAEHVPVHIIQKLGRDISIIGDLSSFFALIKLFRAEKPAVVHLNSSKIGGIGAIAARLCGVKKIVFTVHGFAFNEERPWWQKVLIIAASWLSVFFATDIICINRREYEQIMQWPLVKQKAKLIYNGLTTPKFARCTEARAHLLSLDSVNTHNHGPSDEPQHPVEIALTKEPLYVGTISELVTNKGLVYALEAIAQLPDVHFIVIGIGDQSDTLKEQARSLGISDRVHFTGFVADASQYLKAFDVFLLSSIKEGLPYVILEAGCAKIPVVSTSVGGIPDLITDMEHGILVQTRKPQELARAISFMQEHPRQAQIFAKNLHDRVAEEFSIERMVRETIVVYGLPTANQ